MVARHDLTSDPQVLAQLLVVRRGTAYYQRQLALLSDADLDGPSLLPGWSRRHVIAHVGYNARALTRLVRWAVTGVETPMYASVEARGREIEEGASQPPRALRHLDQHAAISLDVEWRDSPPEAWSATVRTAQGREVAMSETVWMRTREVWLHAIDLDNGAAFGQVPDEVLIRLLGDITGLWERTGRADGLRVHVTDRPGPQDDGGVLSPDPDAEVAGTLAAVTAWASGRTSALLERGADIEAPRWI